ncbi:MAG TPA: hypothetical protein VLA04_02610 [Verrucomicrobiae bacterium]|nr:hypothetical protein [Verrucomicrobiae bacterium]
MATAKIGERHFTLQGNSLTLFGKTVVRKSSREESDSNLSLEVMRDEVLWPLRYRIEQTVGEDWKAGKANLIASVRISASTALEMWGEGWLYVSELSRAKETFGHIELIMELYDGQKFTVWIMKDEDLGYPYATYDESGEVIP